MKIVIGIIQDPKKIEGLISQHQGKIGSLTEVGPFVSQKEALIWLDFLKSKIGDIEEISYEHESPTETVWYGFTFEKASIK